MRISHLLVAVAASAVTLMGAFWLGGIGDALGKREVLVLGPNSTSQEQNVAVIRSRFDGANEMRFGNTREEMRQSTWEPFLSRRIWYLPGFNYKTQAIVHAEFRGPGIGVVELEAPVVATATGGAPDGLAFPILHLPDARSSDRVLTQDFEAWNERWVTYQDAFGYGNVFFPMSHERAGGVDGGGYVWTSASRWALDPPEEPDSILVALVYWKWLFPPAWRAGKEELGTFVNLSRTTLEVSLRGHDLRLGNAQVTFWVLCDGARWHLKQPLQVADDRWVRNEIALPTDPSAWDLSWSRDEHPARLNLARVESVGFAFRGFQKDELASGVFDMDALRLTRQPAQGLAAHSGQTSADRRLARGSSRVGADPAVP
jgi:hypothetical protein